MIPKYTRVQNSNRQMVLRRQMCLHGLQQVAVVPIMQFVLLCARFVLLVISAIVTLPFNIIIIITIIIINYFFI